MGGFRILSDLALLEEEAEGLVEHGPGEVLGGHLAPAPVTPTRTGLVQHTVLQRKICYTSKIAKK